MKHTKKRILSAIIAALMLMTAACSSSDSITTETTAVQTETEVNVTETEPDILESIGSYNFDNADFTVICQHTAERPNAAPEEETGDTFSTIRFIAVTVRLRNGTA